MGDPFEFGGERDIHRNYMGLPYGEEITIVGRIMWTQCTSVTDRQTVTDGQNYDD